MQNKNIINLIGLQDVIINKVEEFNNTKFIHIEMIKVIPTCPQCKSLKSHIHDYRTQNIKDIPILGMKSILVLKKRRFKCVSCGKKYYEVIPFIGKLMLVYIKPYLVSIPIY